MQNQKNSGSRELEIKHGEYKNMKSVFFKLIISMVLVLEPVQATNEEESLPPTQHALSQRENLPLIPKVIIEDIPDECLMNAFRFLCPNDLGRIARVSTRWESITWNPALWRHVGLTHYGDFLSEKDLRENPKQQVISHFLSVIVNATENLEEIERLVSRYQLNLYIPPFKKYLGEIFLTDLVTNPLHFDEFIAQGNEEFIKRKIEGLSYGKYGYEKDRKAAREFIDSLVKKDNLVAIKKKAFMVGYRGNIDSSIGYERDPQIQEELDQLLIKKGDLEFTYMKIRELYGRHWDKLAIQASRELNDLLVERGDLVAIERKIMGLSRGMYGYEKDPGAAREFNDLLVERGDSEAIDRKIVALSDAGTYPLPFRGYSCMYWNIEVPTYGYEKAPLAARELNESLVAKGNPKAIERKIKGLLGIATGRFSNPEGCFTVNLTYGYEKNPGAAREFNEQLVERGDLAALERKTKGLAYGEYGYEKVPGAAREFNDLLVEREDPEAIERKAKGLTHGEYGYNKDSLAGKKLNNFLIEQGNLQVIQRKIEGLLKGEHSYEKDPGAAREFIESLVASEFPVVRAIGKYIKAFAMKYGISELGYEQDRARAIEFIKENYVPY